MKERFKNILNMEAKKHGIALCLFIGVCIVGANSLVGCGMVEEISNNDIPNQNKYSDQNEDSHQIYMSSYNERRTEKLEGELSMYKLVLSPSENPEEKIWKSEDGKYNFYVNSTDGEYYGAVVFINDTEYPFSYVGYAPVAEEPEFAVYDVNKDGIDDFLFRGEAYRTEMRQDVYLSAPDGNYIELGDITWNNLNPDRNAFSFEAKYVDDYCIHVVSDEWNIDEVVPIQSPSWLDIVYAEGIYDEKGKATQYGSELLLNTLQGQSVKYIKNDSDDIELIYNAQIEAGYSEYCLGWCFSFIYSISDDGYTLKSVSLKEFPYGTIVYEGESMYETVGVVNVDALKVHKAPSADAEVVALLKEEQKVNILAEQGEFYQIQMLIQEQGTEESNKVLEGYVRKEYVDVE